MRLQQPMETIRELILKHLRGIASASEEEELQQWAASSDSNRQLLAELKEPAQVAEHFALFDAINQERAWHKISDQRQVIPEIKNYRSTRIWLWRAAAVVAVVITTYLWQQQPAEKIASKNTTNIPALANDIEPGTTGAVLTLSDGTQILLDTLENGVVANQTGADIHLNDGHLAYRNTLPSSEVSYNTLSTPKGRQFKLILPDGSKVWLNAGSTLRYPTAFIGTYRQVQMEGEAYFEVAPDARQPFKVNINEETAVEVLGTSFNITSYKNERDIKTTLIDGAVLVRKAASIARLKPGQQAQVRALIPSSVYNNINDTTNIVVANNADIEKIVAWKNGYFDFDKTDLAEVMRQLERWYDVDVRYENGVPPIEFFGEMSRGLKLSEVVKILKASKVNVTLSGRTLLISK